jgi:hypothetical protein
VSVITRLLKELPAAAGYRAELEALEREHARLQAENAGLREELAQYINNWETLDWDAVRALVYLSRHGRGQAGEIAQSCGMHIQIAESYLGFLAAQGFVRAPQAGEPHYGLEHKGRRYLRERGLHE